MGVFVTLAIATSAIATSAMAGPLEPVSQITPQPGAPLDAPGLQPLLRIARDHGLEGHLRGFLPDALGGLDERYEYAYSELIHDLSGDGRRDLAAVRWTSRLIDAQHSIRTTIDVLEGSSGRKLWSYSSRRGALVWPMEATVGSQGERGLILIEVEGFELETTDLTWRVKAFDRRGRKQWSRSFPSTIVGDWPWTYVAHDLVVSIDLFDAVGRGQTDVLVGRGEVVDSLQHELRSGVISASVIEGRNGGIVTHPLPVTAVSMIPFPSALHDIDGDGLDDYFFVRLLTAVDPPDEGGPARLDAGALEGRRGTDGQTLWLSGGFDFVNRNIWFRDPGDFIGDEAGDLFVQIDPILLRAKPQGNTYLVDGSAGKIAWLRPGTFPYFPGDIDGNGSGDVITQALWSQKGRETTRIWAHTTNGSRLWRKDYVTEHPLLSCCIFQIPSGDDDWGVGDHNVDGLTDAYVSHWVPDTDQHENFIVDAEGGRLLGRGLDTFFPLPLDTDGGSADHATIEWVLPGDLSVEVFDTHSGRRSVSSLLRFDVPLEPTGMNVWTRAAHLNDDRCADITIDVITRTDAYSIAINGATGKLMWGRSIGTERGRVEAVNFSDLNEHC